MTPAPFASELRSVLEAVDGLFLPIVAGPDGHGYRLARWLFLRGLGLVYLVAFVSLWTQVDGLFGSRGILPIRDHLAALGRGTRKRGTRLRSVLRAPTLFWLGASDCSLHLACAGGVATAVLLLCNVATGPVLAVLWGLYLSFAAAGQVFLSYQWDVLLLESGFLALFLAPWSLVPGPFTAAPVDAPGHGYPILALVLLWWLLFRLNFQSGTGKLASGDPSWRNLTALRYHFWTQPLPTWTAWYADKAPDWTKRLATAATHVIEIGFPFLIFGTRETRLVAFGGIVLLQLLIFLTGNYNFFNLLTIFLAFLLLDDAAWSRLLPDGVVDAVLGGASPAATATVGGEPGLWVLALTCVAAAAWLVLGLARIAQSLTGAGRLPSGLRSLLRRVDPWRTLNSYGLFRVMTKRRPEIVVEGSRDGETWKEFEFRYKPGDPGVPPPFVEPHQPRLDWQMWFAALGSFHTSPWFRSFLSRLLQGAPEVVGLLERCPLPPGEIRHVRARLYEYRFTTWEERRASGAWWVREEAGRYSPVLRRS